MHRALAVACAASLHGLILLALWQSEPERWRVQQNNKKAGEGWVQRVTLRYLIPKISPTVLPGLHATDQIEADSTSRRFLAADPRSISPPITQDLKPRTQQPYKNPVTKAPLPAQQGTAASAPSRLPPLAKHETVHDSPNAELKNILPRDDSSATNFAAERPVLETGEETTEETKEERAEGKVNPCGRLHVPAEFLGQGLLPRRYAAHFAGDPGSSSQAVLVDLRPLGRALPYLDRALEKVLRGCVDALTPERLAQSLARHGQAARSVVFPSELHAVLEIEFVE